MLFQLNSYDDWNRYVLCRAVVVLVLLGALALLGGCGGGGSAGGNTAAVHLSVATVQKTASLDSPLGQLWTRFLPWLPEVSEAVAVSVSDIASIEVQVSASDINPTQIVQVNVPSATSGQEISLALDVDAGADRTFTVYGLNALHERIYRGSQSGVTLTAGGQTALAITLTDIPRVTLVAPGNGATNVSTATAVNVTFSKAMDVTTINSATFTVSSGGGGVAGAIACNDPCTQATFTPTAPLPYSTAFTVTVDQTVTDTFTPGTPMNNTFMSSFTTAPPAPVTTGTVAGTVTSATTGTPINGATVSVLTTALTATTGADGTFVINDVPVGSQTIQATAAGFITNSVSVTVTVGSTSTVTISLSPSGIVPDQIRIILNWGATPLDLDAHLSVPTQPEVYFGNPGSLTAPPYAQLDRDDQDGFGPETITIAAPAPTPPPRYSGTYCYYVHNWSGSPVITSSGASIQVLNGTTEIGHFVVPPTGVGIYWNVFTIDGATGALTPLGDGNGVISATAGCL